MAWKTVTAGKPTFYLDQSTLSVAFRSAGEAPYATYAPLKPWIERVAREANLCLSPIHIWELAKWPDTANARALAAWLDGMPLVCVRMPPPVDEQDEEQWVRVVLNRPPSTVDPFAGSLVDSLQQMKKLAAELGVNDGTTVSDVLPAFQIVRAVPRFQGMGENYAIVHRNDPNRGNGWRREFDERMNQARYLLVLKEPSLAQTVYGDRDYPDRAWALYESDPKAFPMLRVHRLFKAGMEGGIDRRDPGSKKDLEQLSGILEDGLHLVGAALCDIFTCDQVVGEALGTFRQGLGRLPQIVEGGRKDGRQGFMTELMATWP